MFKLKVTFTVDSEYIFMVINCINYDHRPITTIKPNEVPIDLMWTQSLFTHKVTHSDAYIGEFLKLY